MKGRKSGGLGIFEDDRKSLLGRRRQHRDRETSRPRGSRVQRPFRPKFSSISIREELTRSPFHFRAPCNFVSRPPRQSREGCCLVIGNCAFPTRHIFASSSRHLQSRVAAVFRIPIVVGTSSNIRLLRVAPRKQNNVILRRQDRNGTAGRWGH